jgi:cell division protein ZapA
MSRKACSNRSITSIKDAGIARQQQGHRAERIAIMAALNIAHEFLTTKVGGGFDIAEIKRRMAGMETVLDRAMSEQNELF